MWKIISHHPDYEVSDSGDVRRVGSDKNLKPWSHRSGHLYVRLGKYDKSRQVHHLVLEAFVSARPQGMECLHKDGNPKDNNIANLRWGTRAENIQDYRKHNGRYMMATLTTDQVIDIRNKFSGRYGEMAEIGRAYGVCRSAIRSLLIKKTHR